MKNFLITASVAGVLLVGAIAFVSVTSDDVATAQPAPNTESITDISNDISDDTTIGSLVDSALDKLQDAGVLTPEAINEINDAIDEATVDLDDMTVGDVKALIAEFDWDSMVEKFKGEIEGLDLENLDLENLELPDGWEIPEGFDEEWLNQDWFKDFSFDTFDFPDDLEQFMSDIELPDGFDLDSFDLNSVDLDGFSFGGDHFKDVDPEALMEAFKNGTLDELFDFDIDGLMDGFEWFGPWLDEVTTQSVNGASA